MTNRVEKFLEFVNNGEYKKQRKDGRADIDMNMDSFSLMQQNAQFLKRMLQREEPLFYENDIFGFNRTYGKADYYAEKYVENDKNLSGPLGNVTVDYANILKIGLPGIEEKIRKYKENAPKEKEKFYDCALQCIEEIIKFAKRYAAAAPDNIKEAFENVCKKAPGTYFEALITIKIVIFALRCIDMPHVTLGGFDRYMYPYFEADIKRGKTTEELYEITQLFFISLNIDTDIYIGVQTGDNGQSMVLGGLDKSGKDIFNEVSKMCMKASMELNLIDPKINLRVHKNTPFEIYRLGTELTKKGLGFPQYSNDDVVISGLKKLGYDEENCYDYTVAACWEFIIPGKGMDIPNIETFNFPLVFCRTLEKYLDASKDFDSFLSHMKDEIKNECGKIIKKLENIVLIPSPCLSIFMSDCIEKGLDVSQQGCKYNNFGCHGAGLATAADSLSAVKTVIYDEKSVSKDELKEALKNDFEGFEKLRKKLLACPKMGDGSDLPEDISVSLLDAFSDNLNGKKNRFGGIFRAGTGSAMEYILSAAKVGATPDGRNAGAPYGSSFSPSLEARPAGLLSVIHAFTKSDLTKTINGGPLTVEIHDQTFRNDDGINKVAMAVRAFIDLGGHQIQLNSVNKERLLDAQKHPEKYKNLIVRVWGWSGYFGELDLCYQNHIIKRCEFNL